MFDIQHFVIETQRESAPNETNVHAGFKNYHKRSRGDYRDITADEWRKILFDPHLALKFAKKLHKQDLLSKRTKKIEKIKVGSGKWVTPGRLTPGQALIFMRGICPSEIKAETF